MKNEEIQYGVVRNARELGSLARAHRKSRALPLETVGGLGNLGKRFLSEFERGKETAEIGKVIKALNTLGLEVIIQPRYVQGKANLKVSSANLVGTGHVEKVKNEQHGKS